MSQLIMKQCNEAVAAEYQKRLFEYYYNYYAARDAAAAAALQSEPHLHDGVYYPPAPIFRSSRYRDPPALQSPQSLYGHAHPPDSSAYYYAVAPPLPGAYPTAAYIHDGGSHSSPTQASGVGHAALPPRHPAGPCNTTQAYTPSEGEGCDTRTRTPTPRPLPRSSHVVSSDATAPSTQAFLSGKAEPPLQATTTTKDAEEEAAPLAEGITPFNINLYAETHCLLCGEAGHPYALCSGFDPHLLCLFNIQESSVYVMRREDWLEGTTLEDVLCFMETRMHLPRRRYELWLDGKPLRTMAGLTAAEEQREEEEEEGAELAASPPGSPAALQPVHVHHHHHRHYRPLYSSSASYTSTPSLSPLLTPCSLGQSSASSAVPLVGPNVLHHQHHLTHLTLPHAVASPAKKKRYATILCSQVRLLPGAVVCAVPRGAWSATPPVRTYPGATAKAQPEKTVPAAVAVPSCTPPVLPLPRAEDAEAAPSLSTISPILPEIGRDSALTVSNDSASFPPPSSTPQPPPPQPQEQKQRLANRTEGQKKAKDAGSTKPAPRVAIAEPSDASEQSKEHKDKTIQTALHKATVGDWRAMSALLRKRVMAGEEALTAESDKKKKQEPVKPIVVAATTSAAAAAAGSATASKKAARPTACAAETPHGSRTVKWDPYSHDAAVEEQKQRQKLKQAKTTPEVAVVAPPLKAHTDSNSSCGGCQKQAEKPNTSQGADEKTKEEEKPISFAIPPSVLNRKMREVQRRVPLAQDCHRRYRTVCARFVPYDIYFSELRTLFFTFGEVYRVRVMQPGEKDVAKKRSYLDVSKLLAYASHRLEKCQQYRSHDVPQVHMAPPVEERQIFCMCFVEYASEAEAIFAATVLNGFPISAGLSLRVEIGRQPIAGFSAMDYDALTGRACTFGTARERREEPETAHRSWPELPKEAAKAEATTATATITAAATPDKPQTNGGAAAPTPEQQEEPQTSVGESSPGYSTPYSTGLRTAHKEATAHQAGAAAPPVLPAPASLLPLSVSDAERSPSPMEASPPSEGADEDGDAPPHRDASIPLSTASTAKPSTVLNRTDHSSILQQSTEDAEGTVTERRQQLHETTQRYVASALDSLFHMAMHQIEELSHLPVCHDGGPGAPHPLLLLLELRVREVALCVHHGRSQDGQRAAQIGQEVVAYAQQFAGALAQVLLLLRRGRPAAAADFLATLSPTWRTLFTAASLSCQRVVLVSLPAVLEEGTLAAPAAPGPLYFPRVEALHCFLQRLLQLAVLLDNYVLQKAEAARRTAHDLRPQQPLEDLVVVDAEAAAMVAVQGRALRRFCRLHNLTTDMVTWETLQQRQRRQQGTGINGSAGDSAHCSDESSGSSGSRSDESSSSGLSPSRTVRSYLRRVEQRVLAKLPPAEAQRDGTAAGELLGRLLPGVSQYSAVLLAHNMTQGVY